MCYVQRQHCRFPISCWVLLRILLYYWKLILVIQIHANNPPTKTMFVCTKCHLKTINNDSHGCAFVLISIFCFPFREETLGDAILPWSYELWSLPTFCVEAGRGWIGCWLTTTSPRWCNTSCSSTLAWNRPVFTGICWLALLLKPSNLLNVIGYI